MIATITSAGIEAPISYGLVALYFGGAVLFGTIIGWHLRRAWARRGFHRAALFARLPFVHKA